MQSARIFVSIMLAGFSSLGSLPAAAQSDGVDLGSAQMGRRLAVDVCSECHAVDPGDQISPNFNAPAFQDIADNPQITSLALGVWFRSPHPTMPNFILEANETADIIAYILSLRAQADPSKP